MKKIFRLISILSVAGLIATGCSELKKEIPTSPAYSGGEIVHGKGFLKVGDPNYHGTFIKNNSWNIQSCQSCHGASYTGGTSHKSCNDNSCHNQANGPEACNTCHGDFYDSAKTAPIAGAHATHLFNTNVATVVVCKECHVIPTTVFQAGHLDSGLPADVSFNGPLGTMNVTTAPAYNTNNQTCTNTFCHGNFTFSKESATSQDQYAFTGTQITGNNFTPVWTKVDNSQAACGTCHGLPPKGHVGENGGIGITDCGNSGCHKGIVDATGKIIDKVKHMNGLPNVRGN
ncbi:MAG: CxxxxCH/CxxCH domain-containing protein [Ignavibacteria bacterium]